MDATQNVSSSSLFYSSPTGCPLFSQTSQYALRAVVWLAEHRNEGPVGNKRIASDTQVPASYLSKILHDLASAGFLTSRRGVGGGFQLIAHPKELTMLDVVNAVDPLKRINFCAHLQAGAADKMCPMHQRLNQAISSVERLLADSTIEDVMQEHLATAKAEGRLHDAFDSSHGEFGRAPAANAVEHSPTAPPTAHNTSPHHPDASPLATF